MRPFSERARSAIASKLARRRSPGASSAITASTASAPLRPATDIRVGGPRLIAWCSASRMIWKIATCACSVSVLRRLDVEVDLDAVRHPELVGERADGGPEALVAQHDRLELEGEVAEGPDRLPLLLERRPEHLLRLVGPILLDRVR